ncbi:MAG: zeta toxin [Bacteroidetes bacterium B1(2017)]|nr:MAG: zeta toxin [Bacteroidetes bacterium B1(2017)]
MNSKNLYIVAGCNGAGKTTASFNILPEILDCKEFVNADEIAKGISPFNPEGVSIEAGRIMLDRIKELLKSNQNFAFETTLASITFTNFIGKAKQQGYNVTLIFLWLENEELAISRVFNRVKEGGHNIPESTIRRRYHSGINNLFQKYWDLPDSILIYDTSTGIPDLICTKALDEKPTIIDSIKFNHLLVQANERHE